MSGIKLLTRFRLGFSHLSEHKFRHILVDSLNPLSFDIKMNIKTLTATIIFIKVSGRFDQPLLLKLFLFLHPYPFFTF